MQKERAEVDDQLYRTISATMATRTAKNDP